MTTITINRATVERALEALEMCRLNGSQYLYGNERDLVFSAIKDLRATLAQQAEPVEGEQPAGVVVGFTDEGRAIVDHDGLEEGWVLYTAPPQRKPLTDEEIDKIYEYLCNTVGASCKTMARAVERAHGIKE